MEHPNPPFGRLGTIDAGDMVLVQKVSKRSDIIPHGGPRMGAEAEKGWQTYGDYGDVIVYHPDGDTKTTPIIHRAMCWVDVENTTGEITYTIQELGIYHQRSLLAPEYGIKDPRYNTPQPITPNWTLSGFLTKGDHNDVIDQVGGISNNPVQLRWITGKARLEIPWLGAINLFFSDVLNGNDTMKNVHEDSWICLGLVIAILISIPIVFDVYEYMKKRKQR
jgi:signal peptidase I